MTHTPGPWAATGFESIVVNDSLGRSLALAPGSSTNLEEMKSNARLIAAAPDMLAALEELVKGMEEHGAEKWFPHRIARAHAAIAKAKGGAA